MQSLQSIQLTPDFLNPILRPFVEPENATLLGIRSEPLGGEGSYNAVLLRLYLSYDQLLTSGPKALIAKLPIGRTELHERAAVFQPGARENWFYRTGAQNSLVQTPRCYCNSIDPTTGESILLLEDGAPAKSGSWLAGAGLDQAGLVISAWPGSTPIGGGEMTDQKNVMPQLSVNY